MRCTLNMTQVLPFSSLLIGMIPILSNARQMFRSGKAVSPSYDPLLRAFLQSFRLRAQVFRPGSVLPFASRICPPSLSVAIV
jgi:hypothetical protein